MKKLKPIVATMLAVILLVSNPLWKQHIPASQTLGTSCITADQNVVKQKDGTHH